jgi:hypothetical protein
MSILQNKILKIFRVSNTSVTATLLDFVQNAENQLYLLEINRTQIPDIKIQETIQKRAPNLRIVKACNVFWNPTDKGLRHPLVSSHVAKPLGKGQKAPKKDDKSPAVAYEIFQKENKPLHLIHRRKV